MSVSIATKETYPQLTAEGFTIVDFYSTTCVPCKMLSRVLEDLTLDYPFLNIVKVNITDEPRLGVDHEIEAVPTVLFLKDGVELEKVVGLMDEDEIVEKISAYYYG
ncbi:MAG: thioredoxin family protein [Oscillospiraceae bacterium]|nr:thioredoxin family protein [Oscillospiraceae bacterium]